MSASASRPTAKASGSSSSASQVMPRLACSAASLARPVVAVGVVDLVEGERLAVLEQLPVVRAERVADAAAEEHGGTRRCALALEGVRRQSSGHGRKRPSESQHRPGRGARGRERAARRRQATRPELGRPGAWRVTRLYVRHRVYGERRRRHLLHDARQAARLPTREEPARERPRPDSRSRRTPPRSVAAALAGRHSSIACWRWSKLVSWASSR